MPRTPTSLRDFNHNFNWSPDGSLDSWRVLRTDRKGDFSGDCDDYAVTVAYLESGSSWMRFWLYVIIRRHVFWYTKTKAGQSHMMLWVWGKGWIDNINPTYGERKFRRIFPAPVMIAAIKMMIGAMADHERGK